MEIREGKVLRYSLGSTKLLVQVNEGYRGDDPNHEIPVTVLKVRLVGDVKGLERGHRLIVKAEHLFKSQGRTTVYKLELPDDLRLELESIAKENNSTVVELIERAIRWKLKQLSDYEVSVGDKLKDVKDDHIHTIERIDGDGVIHTDRIDGIAHRFDEDQIGISYIPMLD